MVSGQQTGRARVNLIEEVTLTGFDGQVMLAEPIMVDAKN
jgi:hypothetical protein